MMINFGFKNFRSFSNISNLSMQKGKSNSLEDNEGKIHFIDSQNSEEKEKRFFRIINKKGE